LSDLYSSFIPEDLLKEAHIANFDRIRAIVIMKHKSTILISELSKKSFIEGINQMEGSGLEENEAHLSFLHSVGGLAVRASLICHRLIHGLQHFTVKSYVEIGEVSQWHNFITANQFIDSVISMIKDDRLS